MLVVVDSRTPRGAESSTASSILLVAAIRLSQQSCGLKLEPGAASLQDTSQMYTEASAAGLVLAARTIVSMSRHRGSSSPLRQRAHPSQWPEAGVGIGMACAAARRFLGPMIDNNS